MVAIGAKYTFSYKSSQLSVGEKTIPLTSREAELLKLFLLNKNQVMSRQSILLHIWGNDDFFTGRSLDVFITKLRKYLQQDPAIRIMNIRGIGYKLIV
jgi:DNA-binding response OmpR family regulator